MTRRFEDRVLDLLLMRHVLGLNTPRVRAIVERWVAADPALESRLLRTHERFEAIDATLDPVPPPARVRRRIEARLFGRSRWWQRALTWQLASAALASALVAAVLVLSPSRAPDVEPVVVALLQNDHGFRAALLATDDPSTLRLVSNRAPGTQDYAGVAAASGAVLELWAFAPGSERPESLGVMRRVGTTSYEWRGDDTALRRRSTAAILAISAEPPGGSPTGQPTGPVIATGRI